MPDKELLLDELIEKVRTLTAASWSNERIAQFIFDAGLSKSDAVVAFSRGGGLPREEALKIVHHSKAYEARKAVDEAWNSAMCDLLEDDDFIASLETGREKPTGTPE